MGFQTQDSNAGPSDITVEGHSEPQVPTAKKPKKQVVRTKHGIVRSVFYPAVATIILLVICALAFPQKFNDVINAIARVVIDSSGWYYILVIILLFIFVLTLVLSRKGDIVLGKDEDKPEYSLMSWFAMLFAAGMGIGLVFFGAAEPLTHFATPHPGAPLDIPGRAQDAMVTTFLHWGLSAWGVYVIIGLGIAYAVYRKGLPASIRYTIKSVLGDRVEGVLGSIIDIAAIVGTLLGVSISLCLGALQMASGIEYMTGIHLSRTVVLIFAAGISILAGISVSSGVNKGIRMLSNANLILAVVMLMTILLLGPKLFILDGFIQNVGYYIQNLLVLSTRTLPLMGDPGVEWMSEWTIYYWAWWISWSPFVGIFIARISRGRTIREFIMGVVLVPSLVTFFWFAVLGGTALYQQIFGPGNLIGPGGVVDSTTLLFQMFANMPASKLLSGVAIVLLVIFFVTSSDSASYVMSMISTNGDSNPQLPVRITWAAFTGIIAVTLLASGSDSMQGVKALQKLVVMSALPMTVVLVLIAVSLWRDLSKEEELLITRQRRLMRSDLVDDVVESVTSQIDSSVLSSSNTVPIEFPYYVFSPHATSLQREHMAEWYEKKSSFYRNAYIEEQNKIEKESIKAERLAMIEEERAAAKERAAAQERQAAAEKRQQALRKKERALENKRAVMASTLFDIKDNEDVLPQKGDDD